MTTLESIFAPLDEPEPAPPSPDVPFGVGDYVHIHKLGWCGRFHVAEIRGEHARGQGELYSFEKYRAVWFHHTELGPGERCTCTKEALARAIP